jgi:hypothetical protein
VPPSPPRVKHRCFARLAIFRPGIILGNAHTGLGRLATSIIEFSVAAEIALDERQRKLSAKNAAMKRLATQSETATDLAVRLLLFKLIIRLANLVAVWWLLVLEFRFSAGEYQFKLQSMPEPTCRTFCATFSGCFDGCSLPTFVHFAAMGCNKQVGRIRLIMSTLCGSLRMTATHCKTAKNRLKTRRLHWHTSSILVPGTIIINNLEQNPKT